jgi:hypothetical protein
MKLLFSVLALFFCVSSYSQSSCELRVQQLRERLADVSARLRACEAGQYPDGGELEYLRTENLRLREANRRLQRRIDELEGRYPTDEFFCAAGCVSYAGMIDMRYLMTATAVTELEADLLAKQTTQRTYACNYGVQKYKCEEIRTTVPRSFCTAACVDYSGNADQRFLVGARGRNVTEAEVAALKGAQAKYACNYGVKIVDCR